MAKLELYLLTALVAIGLALGATSSSAGFVTYEVEKVALEGETAPETSAASFTSIDSYTVDLNTSGQVAFGATLSGATPAWGIFVYSDGVGSARAVTGDAAPAPLTGTYRAVGYPTIDDAGGVSQGVMIRTSPTTSANALILAGESGDSVLVADTDSAPGSGGTLDVGLGDLAFHARGSGGSPVFGSTVTGGANASGIFVGSGRAVALAGDSSPVGGSYASFSYPGGNASGKVAFPAELAAATVASGLFVDSGAGPVPLVLAGDLDPEGETYLSMFLPQVNSAGDVMFAAEWVPTGSEQGGVYVNDAGGIRSVVRTDEPLPGTGGGTVTSLDGLPHFSDGGRVTFSASVAGGDVAAGVFAVQPNGTLLLVARDGDPVPGAPGDSFTGFGHAVSNDAGQVAFAGVTSAGANGVFLATATLAVPALSPPALALLAGLVLLIGGRLGQASRRCAGGRIHGSSSARARAPRPPAM
jgi:hypothetical protein